MYLHWVPTLIWSQVQLSTSKMVEEEACVKREVYLPNSSTALSTYQQTLIKIRGPSFLPTYHTYKI